MATILQDLANLIFKTLLLPGEILLQKFAEHAPGLAVALGMANKEPSLLTLIGVSLFSWLLLAVAAHTAIRLCRALIRTASSWSQIFAYRTISLVASFKTRLVCKSRQWFRYRARTVADIPTVEFDDLDLAVLRSAAACGPGFTTSAPELAGELTLQPAQVQRVLDKLSKYRMIDNVIGSSDGFENYRLSRMGAAFMTKWKQHATI